MEFIGFLFEFVFLALGLYIYLLLSGRINLTGSAAQNLAIFKQNTGSLLKILALILALFAGMTNDEPAYWGDVGGNLEQSNDIKTVLNFFGSVSTSHLDELSVSKVGKIESLLGCEDAFMPECADELAEFAVENHSNVGDAIVETYHGTADNEVPYSQSKYVTTALKNDGVQAKLNLTPGYGHEMSMFFDYLPKVKSFLKKNL